MRSWSFSQKKDCIGIKRNTKKSSKKYDDNLETINWWKQSKNADLELVGKNYPPQKSVEKIETAIQTAYDSTLPIDGEAFRTASKGVMLRLSYNGQVRLVDPSIARFKTKADFLEAVKQAIGVWGEPWLP